MENPIKMADLGVPLFLETPMLNFRGVNQVIQSKVTFFDHPLEVKLNSTFPKGSRFHS